MDDGWDKKMYPVQKEGLEEVEGDEEDVWEGAVSKVGKIGEEEN